MRLANAAALCVALLTTSAAPVRAESHGNRLIETARRFIGMGNFLHTRGPWCADFAGAMLHRAGFHRLTSRAAISYAHYGKPSAPRIGALAILPHHIGFVVGFTKRGPILLSGNHRHKVGVAVYSARKIIAYRRPV